MVCAPRAEIDFFDMPFKFLVLLQRDQFIDACDRRAAEHACCRCHERFDIGLGEIFHVVHGNQGGGGIQINQADGHVSGVLIQQRATDGLKRMVVGQTHALLDFTDPVGQRLADDHSLFRWQERENLADLLFIHT